MMKKVLHFRCPEELEAQLRERAKNEYSTVSAVIIRALHQYLEAAR